MAIPVVAVAGGAALLLWALGQKKQPGIAPTGAGTGAPGTQAQTQNAGTSNAGGQVASAVLGVATTTAGIVVKGITGSATTAATTAATASGDAAVVALTGSAYSAGIGGFVMLGLVLTAIIYNIVETAIIRNIDQKNYAERNASFPDVVDLATQFFRSFVAGVTTRDDYGRNPQLALTPDAIRQAALACLYAAAQVYNGRNDALVKYYTYLGWSAQQMGVAANHMEATPGLNWLDVIANSDVRAYSNRSAPNGQPSTVVGPIAYMMYEFSYPSPLNFPFPTDASPAGRANWNALTAPVSAGEMSSAAVRVFGTAYQAVYNEMRFMGASTGVLLATIEGYGGIDISQQAFALTLGQIFGWQAVAGSFWQTNTPMPQLLNSWWLVDPLTATRFEVSSTHNDGYVRVSKPGVLIGSPPLPPGGTAMSGFGRFGGRRFGAGTFQHECTDAHGNIVGCAAPPPPMDKTAVGGAAVAAASAGQQAQAQASLLPMLLVGGALLLKTGALKALGLGFGDYPRRRRRKVRR